MYHVNIDQRQYEAIDALDREIFGVADQQLFEELGCQRVPNTYFQENSFGNEITLGQKCCRISAKDHNLSSVVVSLGLFDGDRALYPKNFFFRTCSSHLLINHDHVQEMKCYLHALAYLYLKGEHNYV
jgi:hypothetical protein